MRIRLRVTTIDIEESSCSEFYEVNRRQCVIGRQGADIPLPDPGCSRRHAMLYEGPQGELRVTDLHSTNGTYIGRERVIDRSVEPGTTLRIGAMRIDIIDFSSAGTLLPLETGAPEPVVRIAPPPLPRRR